MRHTFSAHVVSYADDFVILSRGHAAEALAWTKAVMTKLGLPPLMRRVPSASRPLDRRSQPHFDEAKDVSIHDTPGY